MGAPVSPRAKDFTLSMRVMAPVARLAMAMPVFDLAAKVWVIRKRPSGERARRGPREAAGASSSSPSAGWGGGGVPTGMRISRAVARSRAMTSPGPVWGMRA